MFTKATLGALLIFVISQLPALADLTCPPSHHPFARGHCSVVRGRHGQWVRGSAKLSGTALNIKLGLETDSAFFGVGGQVLVVIRDSAGRTIGAYKTKTCAIAAKSGGHARIADFSSQNLQLPRPVAIQASSLDVQPKVEQDNLPRPIGIKDWTIGIPIFSSDL